jgi:hypothetical protein
MRKITVRAMPEDIAMQMMNKNHKLSVPAETENCIFHKWTTKLHTNPENDEYMQEFDFALVEFPDGIMHYVRPEQIQFQDE